MHNYLSSLFGYSTVDIIFLPPPPLMHERDKKYTIGKNEKKHVIMRYAWNLKGKSSRIKKRFYLNTWILVKTATIQNGHNQNDHNTKRSQTKMATTETATNQDTK